MSHIQIPKNHLQKYKPVLRRSKDFIKQFQEIFYRVLNNRIEYSGNTPQIDLVKEKVVAIVINQEKVMSWITMYVNAENNRIVCETCNIPPLCTMDILSTYWLDATVVFLKQGRVKFIGGDYDTLKQRYVCCIS